MKKLLLLAAIITSTTSSCDKLEKVSISVVYFNGDKDTINTVWHKCCTDVWLHNGDLKLGSGGTICSGVRSFEIINP